jgi:hypothetical protein
MNKYGISTVEAICFGIGSSSSAVAAATTKTAFRRES